MRDFFSSLGQTELASTTARRTLIALDFDGTLAPITRRPGNARMRPQTRTLLRRVARIHPCLVLSGRSLADLKTRTPAGIHLIGNHGCERSDGLSLPASSIERRAPEITKRWLEVIQKVAADISGIEIEDKRFSLSVHFRRCSDTDHARRAILRALRGIRQDKPKEIGGKCVINLIPDGLPNKGKALLAAMRSLDCDTAIFVGDDLTDEDVFRLRNPRIMTIYVGDQRKSAARYYISRQSQIDLLLRRLCDAAR